MNFIRIMIGLFLMTSSFEVYSRFFECPVDFHEHLKTVHGIMKKVDTNSMNIEESSHAIREVIFDSDVKFYTAKEVTSDKIEPGMYIGIIRYKKQKNSSSRFIKMVVISMNQELFDSPRKTIFKKSHQEDESNKNEILTLKAENQEKNIEIIITSNTHIFIIEKSNRTIFQKGKLVFVPGYQDFDNYCKKNGKINTGMVFIDEDGMATYY